jgi:hypothetical protein
MPLVLVLALAMWPTAAAAQGVPPSPEGTAPVPIAAPPIAIPAPTPATVAPAEAARSRVTIEVGGFLALDVFAGLGALDATDLPRAAVLPGSERSFSMSVRQSRLRAEVGWPGDGLLGGAVLQGLVEVDFAGGHAGADASLPLLRLRHAWASATWAERAHLSLLAGQSWGLLGGPGFAQSLAHLAVPRFAGAGFLYRRAPQLRLAAGSGGDLSWQVQGALLAPLDRSTAPVPTAANATSVGVRSGLPDVAARAALGWRPNGRPLLEVGLSGHAGREKYRLDGQAGQPDGSIDSWGGALDARLDLPRLTLLGAAFAGKNLDVCNTAGTGATQWTDASTGRLLAVSGVQTAGAWGQAQWTATEGLVLLLGAGLEASRRADLPAGGVLWRNVQASGGALLDLGSRWRAGLEGTGYWTRTTAGRDARAHSTQLELSLLCAF